MTLVQIISAPHFKCKCVIRFILNAKFIIKNIHEIFFYSYIIMDEKYKKFKTLNSKIKSNLNNLEG